MNELLTLRGIMFVEGITAMLLYAWVAGTKLPAHGWSYRLTAVGFFGVLGYLSAGQVKAYRLQTPFDAVSYSGLTALSILVTGLTLYVITRTDSTDGT